MAKVMMSPESQDSFETVVVVAVVFVPVMLKLIIWFESVVFVTVTVTSPDVVC